MCPSFWTNLPVETDNIYQTLGEATITLTDLGSELDGDDVMLIPLDDPSCAASGTCPSLSDAVSGDYTVGPMEGSLLPKGYLVTSAVPALVEVGSPITEIPTRIAVEDLTTFDLSMPTVEGVISALTSSVDTVISRYTEILSIPLWQEVGVFTLSALPGWKARTIIAEDSVVLATSALWVGGMGIMGVMVLALVVGVFRVCVSRGVVSRLLKRERPVDVRLGRVAVTHTTGERLTVKQPKKPVEAISSDVQKAAQSHIVKLENDF
ncbi:hypothetical protein KIPB_002159 [Kipferlia bialata]|uniref:Uncharacterized protein n=1 Tax=Kipferlia bialata TaxID=797122 RepID=A0A9K3CRU9_9EUKA|nr:hypothetical protein KIPB_002159 [Kipferlia bialata]|eukprot:g2159.t1